MHIVVGIALPVLGLVTLPLPPLSVVFWVLFFAWMAHGIFRAHRRRVAARTPPPLPRGRRSWWGRREQRRP